MCRDERTGRRRAGYFELFRVKKTFSPASSGFWFEYIISPFSVFIKVPLCNSGVNGKSRCSGWSEVLITKFLSKDFALQDQGCFNSLYKAWKAM